MLDYNILSSFIRFISLLTLNYGDRMNFVSIDCWFRLLMN